MNDSHFWTLNHLSQWFSGPFIRTSTCFILEWIRCLNESLKAFFNDSSKYNATYWRFTFIVAYLCIFPTFHICILKKYILKHRAQHYLCCYNFACSVNAFVLYFSYIDLSVLGVDWLSAPILSIFTIIDIGHFQNRFADNIFYFIFYYYYANKHTIYRWHYLLVNK